MHVVLIILIGITFASLGQILWKIGMDEIGAVYEISLLNIIPMIYNVYIISGLLSYGIGTIFWLIALSRADLSFVYPFIALTFVIIFTASFFLFHEQISLMRLFGAIVIISGIIVLVRG